MPERAVWEEKLHTSNVPLPRRRLEEHASDPLRGRRQWHEEATPLLVWASFGLAPVERAWEPLQRGQECIYVSREQTVRVALVDVASGVVLAWRRTSSASAYRQRAPRAAPDLHPLERLHHRRARRSS